MSKAVIVRLLTLGDSGAGKSSLLLRYTQGEFACEYMPTIGIDFRLKNIEVNGRTVKVQVWDTAGQERFRTITHNYYRGAHGIALVYDTTNEISFYNIKKWIQDVRTYAESNVNLVLIGNKCDLENEKAIPKEKGQEIADEYDVKFFETSAKENINVQEAFSCLVNMVCDRMFSPSTQPTDKSSAKKNPNQLQNVDVGGGSGSNLGCCK